MQLIGANETSMRLAEDRDLFKKAMLEIGAEVPRSGRARSLAEAETVREEIGLPLVIRPSFTLGGLGRRRGEDARGVPPHRPERPLGVAGEAKS